MRGIKINAEKILNRTSITSSLKLVFITFFFIPVLILSIFLLFYLYSTLTSWELDKVDTSFVQTERAFNDSLSSLKVCSDRLYVNKQLQTVLQKQYTNLQDVYEDYASLVFMEEYLHSNKEIISYKIYAENQTLMDNQFIKKIDEKIEYSQWYMRAKLLQGQIFWDYKKDSETNEFYLCLIRSLWNGENFLGVLVINLNPDIVKEELSQQIYETTIFHAEQILYFSSEHFTNNEKQLLLQYVDNQDKTRKVHRFSIRGESVGVVFDAFSPDNTKNMDFVIMCIIPRKILHNATRNIIIVVSSVLVLIVTLTIIILEFFSNYINKRMYKIHDGIFEIKRKNFDIPPTIGGEDEFEEIYHSLWEMSGSMKELIDVVYTQKLEKEHASAIQSEMNFKMLSTQINPHFLFNTLETIRMKSLASGEREVSTMLRLLASLLRYNLSVKGRLVPLSQEIDAVQNYLTIQHMRFGERVSYDVSMMCDIQKIQILPLLIQPLVENSFSHGLENKVSGGFIYILINCEYLDNKQILTVTVEDNGCGINEEKLTELRMRIRQEDTQESKSIGVINVAQRIKLFYEKGSGMEIESEEGDGTKITLKLISYVY